ncbi:hypothetical protein AB0H92_29400 [Streptomyces phaeochromogenes]|uniref:hypothetical protein n=1 Tax=Streptomyces phaeochromogenes TaxID=1923 RepID=UPI0033E646E4
MRLTQVVSFPNEEAVKVSYVVARKGATVAMLCTFNRPRGPQGMSPASVPDDNVRARLEKIGALEVSAAPLK